MPIFADAVHEIYDVRMNTLGAVKSRSIGADPLVLTALNVLVYAQLEGGVKDLVAIIIRDINRRNVTFGTASPNLLRWRNAEDLSSFRSSVSFDNIADSYPFAVRSSKVVKVRSLNKRTEFNQMNWTTLAEIMKGFRFQDLNIKKYAADVVDLVQARNDAAHNGLPMPMSAQLLENQVRKNADIVEAIITDLCLQSLSYFATHKHLR